MQKEEGEVPVKGFVQVGKTRTVLEDVYKRQPMYVQGFSLLGGEPFEPENQVELVKLLRRIKETYPAKNIWCYTCLLYTSSLKISFM